MNYTKKYKRSPNIDLKSAISSELGFFKNNKQVIINQDTVLKYINKNYVIDKTSSRSLKGVLNKFTIYLIKNKNNEIIWHRYRNLIDKFIAYLSKNKISQYNLVLVTSQNFKIVIENVGTYFMVHVISSNILDEPQSFKEENLSAVFENIFFYTESIDIKSLILYCITNFIHHKKVHFYPSTQEETLIINGNSVEYIYSNGPIFNKIISIHPIHPMLPPVFIFNGPVRLSDAEYKINIDLEKKSNIFILKNNNDNIDDEVEYLIIYELIFFIINDMPHKMKILSLSDKRPKNKKLEQLKLEQEEKNVNLLKQEEETLKQEEINVNLLKQKEGKEILKQEILKLKKMPYTSEVTPEETNLKQAFADQTMVIVLLFDKYFKIILQDYISEYINLIQPTQHCISKDVIKIKYDENYNFDISGPSINEIVNKNNCGNSTIMVPVAIIKPSFHSNLLIISLSDKKLYKIEPNIETQRTSYIENDYTYTKYAGNSGYIYSGKWNNLTCNLKHRGLCMWISNFSFIYGKNISNEILKKSIVDFFKWLHDKLYNGDSSCDLTFNFSNNEIVSLLQFTQLTNNQLKKAIAFLLILKIERTHVKSILPMLIDLLMGKKTVNLFELPEFIKSEYFIEKEKCLHGKIKLILNRLKTENYI
jgi:hypothetical protein